MDFFLFDILALYEYVFFVENKVTRIFNEWLVNLFPSMKMYLFIYFFHIET